MNFKQKIANYVLDNVHSSKLPEVAQQGITDGFNSESLLILAGLSKNDNAFEMEHYFLRSLYELDIELPKVRDAVYELLEYHRNEIYYTRKTSVDSLKFIVREVLDSIDFTNDAYSDEEKFHFRNLYDIYNQVESLYANEKKPYSQKGLELLKNAESAILDEINKIVMLSDKSLFTIIEMQPEFPNGQAELFVFLSKNVRYPLSAREQGIYGEIHCGFVIDRDGCVVDVIIKKVILFQETITRRFFRKKIEIIEIHSNPEMEAEVIRVVSSMPKWKPGYQQGRPVRVSYTLPIKFRLG